jgi:hypothetical protein
MGRFIQDYEWMQRLRHERLLPNAEEWQRLDRELPQQTLALRKFIINWIGLPEPLFHLVFRNSTKENITVSNIKYTLTRIGRPVRAELQGHYERPRYILELREGNQDDEFNPPFDVPPNGSKTIDIVLKLSNPRAGQEY